MKKLKLNSTSHITDLVWPDEFTSIALDTPALIFFTDFYKVKPLVIDSSVSVDEIKAIMMKAHVRLKFVLDKELQFLGVISSDDLSDRRILQKVSEGFARTELSVTDLMIQKDHLSALDYNELEGATIGDVIEVLKESGQQHCLVVDTETAMIRGIYSASDLSRMLHLPIDIQDKSSFYKVFTEAKV